MMERLIFTDLGGNNNKFWHAEIDGTTVKTNWGRVGATGQFKDYHFSSTYEAQRKLDSLVNSKLAKGYTRQQTLGKSAAVSVAMPAVQIQHGNDAETSKLIQFLVQRNVHQIQATTTIKVNLATGALTTPLGPVTANGLNEAEALLNRMAAKGSDFADAVNKYLRIVPRDFGRQRVTPEDLFGSPSQLQAEQATIDSLRAVITDMEQQANAGTVVPAWGTKLERIEMGSAEFKRVVKFFTGSMNRNHASANLKLRALWAMSIEAMEKAFNKKIGNEKELWHGTKDSNLLSILKTGYVIPKSGGSIAVTGRMFGDGVYFSDQSTKSLNYATGNAPGQYGGGSARTFMLLNRVAMGREYRPTHAFRGTIPAGYDSCYVRGGTAGVRNNEMIVYKLNQICPTFLCEFGR